MNALERGLQTPPLPPTWTRSVLFRLGFTYWGLYCILILCINTFNFTTPISNAFGAFGVLGYGISKVFFGQFPLPFPGRLVQRFGDASPMGLMWTFMGASPAYVFFAGAMETIGAGLLLFRRTTTLGALVLSGVMLNVA